MSCKTECIPIEPGRIYSRTQAMDAMNWKRKAWTSAIKKGLRVKRHGVRLYVTGNELIRFIESLDMTGRSDCK